MKAFFLLVLASSVTCQQLPVNYNARSIAGAGAGMCPDTQDLTESIMQDIHSLIDSSVLPVLGTGPGHGACGCGGRGWRRAAYLNMSDPTQTCPPAWELIATPRSCGRPSNAGERTCYSAMFPIQGIQYSQVCGRIIGYQKGNTGAFASENLGNPQTINDQYVDGVSLTSGNPRQHIWTFACPQDAFLRTNFFAKCPCIFENEQHDTSAPSFVGNNYFCETGVPPGHQYSGYAFFTDDPLWDGQGCGSSGACECTFNNPPWFCKQLNQTTNADLEVRLCAYGRPRSADTPVELIEIYIK